jgi:anti-sigma factor RsiW
MKGCLECESNIQLYVDCELTGEERDEFLSHVNSCPSCSQAVQEAETFSQRIRAARPAIVAPDSLRSAVLRQMQEAEAVQRGPHLVPHKTPDRRWWSLTAAAVVLILVVAGWFLNRQRQENQAGAMIEAALAAHQQLQRQALPLDIKSESSQEVTSWFQSRVSFRFHMANSGIASDANAQYRLTGGRLLTVNNELVALVVFRLPQELVTLVVCPEHLMKAMGGTVVNSGGVILHSHNQGSLHIVTWNERGLGYVLTSTARSMPNTRQCTSCHSENSSDKTAHISMPNSM